MKTRRKSVRVSIFASCQNKTITTLWAVLSAWMTAVEGEDSRYNDDDEEEMMKLHGKVFLAWSRWIVLSSKEGSNDFCFSFMLNSSPYIHSHIPRKLSSLSYYVLRLNVSRWIWLTGALAVGCENYVILLPWKDMRKRKKVLKFHWKRENSQRTISSPPSCVEFGPSSQFFDDIKLVKIKMNEQRKAEWGDEENCREREENC